MHKPALILLLAVLPLSLALSGQNTKKHPAGEDLVHAELLTDASDFSHPFIVGIRFTISPGWNLYWKNPGDAGLPISVTWNLPKGFSLEPLEPPTPEKIVHDDVIAYGYLNRVVLLYNVEPPPGYSTSAPGVLTANLDWLVCKESCLRGKGTVHMTLDGRDGNAGAEAFVEKYSPPRPPGDELMAGTPSVVNQSLVTIPLKGAAAHTITDFYPEQIPDFVIDHKSINVADGVIRFHVTPYDEQATISEIRGLLISPGQSYIVTMTVPGKH